MKKISKEEFEERMLRIRGVLQNAWIDAYGLGVIDNFIKGVEKEYTIDRHLVSILNHYRKLMQYDLCLSVTKMYETTGANSLKNIQQFAMGFRTGNWGKFPVVSCDALGKAEAYRNGYLAHLDVKVSADPLTNDEMMGLLRPVTDFFNNICINVGEQEWALTDNELNRLHMQRYFDFADVLQKHIKDTGT